VAIFVISVEARILALIFANAPWLRLWVVNAYFPILSMILFIVVTTAIVAISSITSAWWIVRAVSKTLGLFEE
jgi:hypothetical protein